MAKVRRVAIALELEWPYKRHSETFAGAMRYAQEAGNWECFVDDFVQDSLPRDRAKPLPYDGVIGRISGELAAALRRVRMPVVNVWKGSPDQELPGVFVDHAAIGRLLAEHLLSRGFRCFAAQGWGRAYGMQLEEFTATVRESGHKCLAITINADAQEQENAAQRRQIWQRVARWMDRWTLPIGVFIDAEDTARTITQMCHHRGWRVPQDVAIIAGYNEETLCKHPKPSLSSVDVGDKRVGYEAAQLLDRLMDGQPPPKEPILVSPIGIVARESTDYLAVEDDLVREALRFISAHSHRPIGVDEIAAAAATSRPTLERRFRKFLGRPIAAEIRRLRIERAKRELTSTDAPIRRIAQKTGFVDSTQFGRVFRREVGLSPSAYRRQYGS